MCVPASPPWVNGWTASTQNITQNISAAEHFVQTNMCSKIRAQRSLSQQKTHLTRGVEVDLVAVRRWNVPAGHICGHTTASREDSIPCTLEGRNAGSRGSHRGLTHGRRVEIGWSCLHPVGAACRQRLRRAPAVNIVWCMRVRALRSAAVKTRLQKATSMSRGDEESLRARSSGYVTHAVVVA